MYSRTKKIFGTTLEILLPKDKNFDAQKTDEKIDTIFQLFEKYNLIFSRFEENSELSKLNRERKLKVSEPFLELLKLAIKFNKKTDGIFNPLINLASLGYYKDFYSKGFTVDKASQLLGQDFQDFLINAEGDLYAKGLFHGEKWEVGIADPRNEEEAIEILQVTNKAIATSGNNRRKWQKNSLT